MRADTKGGLVLWSRSFTPAFSTLAQTTASPVNALVREAFIEGKIRGEDASFERDGYNVRWTMENGLGLVFVVCSLSGFTISAKAAGGVPSSTTSDIHSFPPGTNEAAISITLPAIHPDARRDFIGYVGCPDRGC